MVGTRVITQSDLANYVNSGIFKSCSSAPPTEGLRGEGFCAPLFVSVCFFLFCFWGGGGSRCSVCVSRCLCVCLFVGILCVSVRVCLFFGFLGVACVSRCLCACLFVGILFVCLCLSVCQSLCRYLRYLYLFVCLFGSPFTVRIY